MPNYATMQDETHYQLAQLIDRAAERVQTHGRLFSSVGKQHVSQRWSDTPVRRDPVRRKDRGCCDGRNFSFRELNQLSARFAAQLRGLGVQPGDRVSLYAENRWEWIVSYHAIARVGAVINPINVMLTPEEVAYIVQDCGACTLIASAEKGRPIAAARPPSLREIIVFGGEEIPDARLFDDLLAAAGVEAAMGQTADDEWVVERQPDDLSTIAYTSGTTGYPKGAMQSHGAVVLNAALFANVHVRTASDIVVHGLPLPHVYGNVIMNSGLMYGLTTVVLSRFVAEHALGAIQEHRATIFDGVPTMYLYMLNSSELEHADLSSLVRCYVGGQTMPVAKMQEVEDASVVPSWNCGE